MSRRIQSDLREPLFSSKEFLCPQRCGRWGVITNLSIIRPKGAEKDWVEAHSSPGHAPT